MKSWRRLPMVLALLAGCGPIDEPEEPTGGTVSAQGEAPRPCGTRSFLLRDIYRGLPGSEPMELTRGDRLLFFTADDGMSGRELWKSSGTGGPGTSRVRDIFLGSGSSTPTDLTMLDDEVFFAADDGERGRELWKSDGTRDGTRRVKDIFPGATGSAPRHLLEFNGYIYFAADDGGTHGRELWRTDGTTFGTRLFLDLTPGEEAPGNGIDSNPFQLIRLNDELFFFTIDEDIDAFEALWRSDGTTGGTFALDNGPDAIQRITPARTLLFYIKNNEGEQTLKRTDGTPGGTVDLLYTATNAPMELTAVGRGRIFFRIEDGTELWTSDGTAAGTVVLKDLGSTPRNLVALGRRLFFTAEDAMNGRELWVSDGTAAGTVLFKDLVPGATSSSPEALTVVDGVLFFSAETPGAGREPWVSNGTPGGTVPLRELAPGPLSSSPMGFIRSGWDVFFTADDGTHGRELWALPFRPRDECDERR